MELAMVGLGRMGGNMARRLLLGGHRVVVWNRTFAKAQELESAAPKPSSGSRTCPASSRRRARSGSCCPTARYRRGHRRARAAVPKADIVIDGGNSPYQHDVERGARSRPRDCANSMRARAAGSGASRSATASWSAAIAAPFGADRARRWPALARSVGTAKGTALRLGSTS